jgi:hypothetical protein
MKAIVAGMLVVLATGCSSKGAGPIADAGASDVAASAGAAGRAGDASASDPTKTDAAADAATTTTDAMRNADVATMDAAPMADAAGEASDAGTAAGTIVPLYTYPSDPSWTAIITARQAHPTVHVVAIVNPDSGPGASRDAAFTAGIAKLISGGIQVIGYVATGYASHSAASMEAAIDTWRTFYPQIEGIFFDEQSNQAADVDYYRTLSQYAKAHGLTYTVGNPGTDTAEAFIGALDTMLIYESKGLPAVATLGGWHAKYAPDNFGVIPYGAAFDAAFVKAARKSVGYIYIQNDDLPNPWDTLPPFFGELLAALE